MLRTGLCSIIYKASSPYVLKANSSAWAATKVIIDAQLESIKEAKTYKNERIITSKQDTHISIEESTKPVINFCANNYLGLSSHPAVIEAGKRALDEYGAGLSSVRFICGTQNLHKKLERKIAQFHGREDSIVYASCFDANAGLFEVLLTSEDAVLSDELNHASIIDGIRLCKAQKYRYKHRDMADLERKLQESSSARMRLIVSDGVFSMDGNIAPLPDICNLAKKYNAMVFLDECHATGVIGKTGRGTEEFFNLTGKVDIINSTLGKALGGAAGGYTTGRAELINLLRQKSRPYLFSNALPPPVVACASQALDLLFESSSLVEKLHKNTTQFRSAIKAAGLNVIGDDHPICPDVILSAIVVWSIVRGSKMSGKKGLPEKQRSAAKRTSDKSGESSATPTQQQSPAQKNQCRPKRRRRNRASSSSSDGVVLEARRDMRHMERLLLHSGKLHVFRAFFDDPTLEFYTRPDGRRRHPAGARNRRPPDENRARAVLGFIGDQEAPVDNDPLEQRPPAVQEDEQGPPSVVSSRGVSSVSSFVNCDQSPPDSTSDFEMVPFEGLPSVGSSPEGAAAARPSRAKHASSSSAAERDDCDYLASVSASDSDEPARTNLKAIRMTERLNLMSVSVDNPPPLPEPEQMSLSSDPETARNSD